MKKQETASATVELLSQLRHTQDMPEEQNQSANPSRLEKYISRAKKEKEDSDMPKTSQVLVHEVNPDNVYRWSEKDRPENELDGVEDLAKNFKQIGQQVPCIVRPSTNHDKQYELIVGERRWRAAKLAKMNLKIIVHQLDDRMAALIQAAENEKRQDLSEFAKGMSYSSKIESGILAQADLTSILGISKQQVSRLLSFSKIPQPLFHVINDFRKVSARTASELVRLSAKNKDYIAVLVELAPSIRTGKFGEKKIHKEIEKRTSPKTTTDNNKKVIDSDGRHLFTWRLDNNSIPSIHFPKSIYDLMQREQIDFNEITEEVKTCLSSKLSKLKG